MLPLLDIETGNLWQDFLSVALDPAHILSELAFTLIFDGLVISFFYGLVFKKILLPRLRREIHADIDAEHHIGHDDEHGKQMHSHEENPGYRIEDAEQFNLLHHQMTHPRSVAEMNAEEREVLSLLDEWDFLHVFEGFDSKEDFYELNGPEYNDLVDVTLMLINANKSPESMAETLRWLISWHYGVSLNLSEALPFATKVSYAVKHTRHATNKIRQHDTDLGNAEKS